MSQLAERPSVCRESPSAFDTLETQFFSDGDELSTASAPTDGWDEPTASVRVRTRRRTRIWLGAAAVGIALGLTAAGASSVRARPATIADPSAAAAAPAPPVGPRVPAPVIAAPPAQDPLTVAPPAPVTTLAATSALDQCQAAFARRARKAVLASCTRAFAENPNDPAIAPAAVMLAETELDRGRFRPALDWAKRAVALDAARADAYVFLGGAEQALGHGAAAKNAYQRYLALAPKGRYAGEVRAVVGSL